MSATGASSRLQLGFSARRGTLEVTVEADVGGRPLCLVGPNGAGKTTVLLAILGIVRPARGRVALGDVALFDAGRGIDLPPEGRGVAYVPQDFGLFPHLTARENVEFALRCLDPAPPAGERRERARALLDRLGALPAAERRPAALSGGERQRVALARALATRPQALLFDEPFAALDAGARGEVRAFLRERLDELALPALVVTHDQADVQALGGEVLVLEAGSVVQRGALDELRARPATRYVAQFARKGDGGEVEKGGESRP